MPVNDILTIGDMTLEYRIIESLETSGFLKISFLVLFILFVQILPNILIIYWLTMNLLMD